MALLLQQMQAGRHINFIHLRDEVGTELVSVFTKNRHGVMPFRFFVLYKEKRKTDYALTTYFLKFTAISARRISFSTFEFPRTENRVKPKLAFRNPNGESSRQYHFYVISLLNQAVKLVDSCYSL